MVRERKRQCFWTVSITWMSADICGYMMPLYSKKNSTIKTEFILLTGWTLLQPAGTSCIFEVIFEPTCLVEQVMQRAEFLDVLQQQVCSHIPPLWQQTLLVFPSSFR